MNNSLGQNISIEDIEKFRVLMELIPSLKRCEPVPLKVLYEEWVNHVKVNFSKAYWKSNELTFKHLFEYFAPQRVIASITQRDAELFLIKLQERAPKGYRVYYRNLRSAFNRAKEWGYVNENCFASIKLGKTQKNLPAFLSECEFEKVSEFIELEVVRDAGMISFFIGLRLGEVINLRWRNVDFENRVLVIGDEEFTTKGKSQRRVPMCQKLYDVLLKKMMHLTTREERDNFPTFSESHKYPILNKMKLYKDRFVFSKSSGKQFTGDYFSKRFKRACKAAGADNKIHFHSLRHSFASNLAQRGVSIYIIKELLGHSSITTSEIYSHLNVESLREAVSKLEGNFNKSVERGNNVKIFRISENI